MFANEAARYQFFFLAHLCWPIPHISHSLHHPSLPAWAHPPLLTLSFLTTAVKLQKCGGRCVPAWTELQPSTHHIHSGKPCDLISPVRMICTNMIAHVSNNKTHILFNLQDIHSEERIGSKHATLLINYFSPFFVYLSVGFFCLPVSLSLLSSSIFLIKVFIWTQKEIGTHRLAPAVQMRNSELQNSIH